MTTYNIVSPSAMSAGQPEDVSVILSNLQAIAAVLNGGIDNGNIDPMAGIVASKLGGYPADASKYLRGDGAWAALTIPTGVPTGSVAMWLTLTAPTDWLLCDGASLDRTAYAALFAVIGTTYGTVDGTHFTLPDLRGRMPVGRGSNALVSALAANDGVAEANRRPRHRHTAHSHTFTRGAGNSVGGPQPNWGGTADTATVNVTTSAVDGGSGVAADSLDSPAFLVVNFIIKAT